MNDEFDELTKGLAQSVTRRVALKQFGLGLAGIALTALFASQAHAADLYADASVTANGDGTAARPYWRITEAVERARLLRQTAAIPPSERIVIHIAAGAYFASQENPVLNHNPRYEARPILLNVPNLTLAGATVLTLDARGLPTGILPGSETLLKSVDQAAVLASSLILISRTTDGGVGDDVTMSGLHLDQPETTYASVNILVYRVSNFRIEGNVLTRTGGGGITTQNASGTIEGNLAFDSGGPGIGFISGGSAALPANVLITRNRALSSEGGLILAAVAAMYQPHVGANNLEIVSQQTTFDRNDLPVTLLPTVVNNDFSQNHTFGLRLVCLPVTSSFVASPRFPSKEAMHGVLVATVTDNSANDNGHYGISVDAAFADRQNKRPDSFSFSGTFQGNQVSGNGRAGFLFAYSAIWVAVEDAPPEDSVRLKEFKYLQNSTCDVTVLDGEAAGFDYDNPVADPFNGTVLNNTLIVNGAVIPPGRKISPLSP